MNCNECSYFKHYACTVACTDCVYFNTDWKQEPCKDCECLNSTGKCFFKEKEVGMYKIDVKELYERGTYDVNDVHVAVIRGWITKEEYEEITKMKFC